MQKIGFLKNIYLNKGGLMKKILDFIDEIENVFFLKFIEPKMKYTENKYELTLTGKFLYTVVNKPLHILQSLIWFFTKRIICLVKGCDIETSVPFNVAEGIYDDEECRRCGAYSELNGYYKSKYNIIYK